jgi:hypothetical protein
MQPKGGDHIVSTKRKKKRGASEPAKKRKPKPAAESRGQEAEKASAPSAIVEPRKRRPKASIYTPALGRAICKMLASGMSLNEVCKRQRMPYEQTRAGVG